MPARPSADPRLGPWPLFGLFTVVNALLAYAPLGLGWKLSIGTLGWLLPLLAALRAPVPRRMPDPFLKKGERRPGPPWWALCLAVGLLARFAGSSHFFRFPLMDEIVNAYFAVHLADHWSWQPFFYWSQLPPLYIWSLGGMVKMFGFSPAVLWTLPALLSWLSLFFFYGAFRCVLNPVLSLVGGLFLSIGFWPVFVSKFSHQVNAMLLVEALALLALGHWMRDRRDGPPVPVSLLLGAGLGLGFYTYFGWPLVALLLGATVIARAWWGSAGERRAAVWVLLVAAVFLVPLVLGVLRHGYGTYFSSLVVGHKNLENDLDWDPGQSLLYFTTFFWEGFRRHFAYNPWWGGFLNPLMGSLFFLGALGLYRRRSDPRVRWTAFAFLVLFVPILFANNTNWFHVAALLPFFMATAALGTWDLWHGTPKPGRSWIFGALLLVSILLDGTNLVRTRNYIDRHQIDPGFLRAYHLLEDKGRQEGPGSIFACFTSYAVDIRLSTMVRPWNRGADPHWAAVLTWRSNHPYFQRLFSGASYVELEEVGAKEPRSVLEFIPWTPGNRPRLERWRRADQALDLLVRDFVDFPRQTPHPQWLEEARQAWPLFEGDPILASTYWELLSAYQESQGDLPAALAAKIEAVRQRPERRAMDLYQLGMLYLRNGRFGLAKGYFVEAGALDSDFAPPPARLEQLDRLEAAVKR